MQGASMLSRYAMLQGANMLGRYAMLQGLILIPSTHKPRTSQEPKPHKPRPLFNSHMLHIINNIFTYFQYAACDNSW